MKILLSFAIIFVFVFNSFASPLVFRATKEIPVEGFVEVGRIDTLKYKQLRIKVAQLDSRVQSNDEYRQFEVVISGIEKDVETMILSQSGYINYSTVIDTPPTVTKITVRGKGKFDVFVWATE